MGEEDSVFLMDMAHGPKGCPCSSRWPHIHAHASSTVALSRLSGVWRYIERVFMKLEGKSRVVRIGEKLEREKGCFRSQYILCIQDILKH